MVCQKKTTANCHVLQRRKALHMKIGSIVIDCNEFDKGWAFWQDTLRYVPKYPLKGGWVVLRDPEGKNAKVSVKKILKSVEAGIRLSVYVYAADQEEGSERLVY